MIDPETSITQDVIIELGLHYIHRLPIVRVSDHLMRPTTCTIYYV